MIYNIALVSGIQHWFRFVCFLQITFHYRFYKMLNITVLYSKSLLLVYFMDSSLYLLMISTLFYFLKGFLLPLLGLTQLPMFLEYQAIFFLQFILHCAEILPWITFSHNRSRNRIPELFHVGKYLYFILKLFWLFEF